MSTEHPLYGDRFNYGLIKPELDSLFEFTANKIEREWHPPYYGIDSSRIYFNLMLRVAINTYKTIFFVCADMPEDYNRRPEYSLSTPPLTRNLFEILTSLLFILEDVPKHILLLHKTGYTEKKEKLNHVIKYRGTDAGWQPYIKEQEAYIASEANFLNLSPSEANHPLSTIGRWPTPDKVLKKLARDYPSSSAIDFIEFMCGFRRM